MADPDRRRTGGSPLGAEIPLPAGADDWERLGAFMGRDPRAALGQ